MGSHFNLTGNSIIVPARFLPDAACPQGQPQPSLAEQGFVLWARIPFSTVNMARRRFQILLGLSENDAFRFEFAPDRGAVQIWLKKPRAISSPRKTSGQEMSLVFDLGILDRILHACCGVGLGYTQELDAILQMTRDAVIRDMIINQPFFI